MSAVKALQDLMTRFPKSGYFYEAKFLTSASLRELGKYGEAIAPLSEILRFSQDNVVNQRAQYELGRIQALQGNKEPALATYQRLGFTPSGHVVYEIDWSGLNALGSAQE